METQKTEGDNQESIKNISQKHLDSIFTSFEKLEYYENLMLVGFSDLTELIQTYNPRMEIGVIQVKNQELLVKELRNILIKTKPILNSENYEKYENKIRVLNEIIWGKFNHKGKKIIQYRWQTSQIEKVKRIYLETGYYLILEESQKIRQELIEELQHLLFSIDNIKQEIISR